MMRMASIYHVLCRRTIALQLQYRIATLIWMMTQVVQPVVYLVVWTAVARANGGHVGSYHAGDFVAYFLVLMLVDDITFTWVIWGFDERIRQGALSPLLLRPIHPIHSDAAENMTYKLLTLPVLIPTALILSLAFHATLHPAPWAVLLFFPVLGLGAVMRFLVEWTMALTSFWTTRMRAIDQMYFVTVLFFSGQVAPLALLPGPIRTLASFLPFQWMIAFPVQLLTGHESLHATIAGIGIQLLWLGAVLGLMRIIWDIGVRRFSAVGA